MKNKTKTEVISPNICVLSKDSDCGEGQCKINKSISVKCLEQYLAYIPSTQSMLPIVINFLAVQKLFHF